MSKIIYEIFNKENNSAKNNSKKRTRLNKEIKLNKKL